MLGVRESMLRLQVEFYFNLRGIYIQDLTKWLNASEGLRNNVSCQNPIGRYWMYSILISEQFMNDKNYKAYVYVRFSALKCYPW